MRYNQLFILIEGDDDENFFKQIIKPRLEKEKYNLVRLWKYAHIKKERVNNFLKSIKAMGADYIYVADINRAPCVTGRKQEIQDKLKDISTDRIIVVIMEIESWYLAGLDSANSKQFEISFSNATDNLTKEQFNSLILKKFDSRIDFMAEILKYFSIEIAKQRNGSFRYFIEKYNCGV